MSWEGVTELVALRDHRVEERKKRKLKELFHPEELPSTTTIAKWLEERRIIRAICEGLKLPAPLETVAELLSERCLVSQDSVRSWLEVIPGVTVETVRPGESLGSDWGGGDPRQVVLGTDQAVLLQRFWTLSSLPLVPPPSRLPTFPSVPKKESTLPLQDRPSWGSRKRHEAAADILTLLETPTLKEKRAVKQFTNLEGGRIREYCPIGSSEDCQKHRRTSRPCGKLHFRKIILAHTDESLGDCSYLDTCRHLHTCKFLHYTLEDPPEGLSFPSPPPPVGQVEPQWVNCDIRTFDLSLLGKFSVIMADPPWDIHMNLPYGTMSDDEMKNLKVQSLQDDGYIFLWVTGRAMETGRECLQLWGYERIEEIVWVKTNQLQRLIRTGRTGHWLNHSKEHCLVGVKGNPSSNRFLDCDVIVAEVRETSRKPDEIYTIIERLTPGTRKLELFGRQHNTFPGWITVGNQLQTTHIVDPQVLQRMNEAKEKQAAEKKEEEKEKKGTA